MVLSAGGGSWLFVALLARSKAAIRSRSSLLVANGGRVAVFALPPNNGGNDNR